MINKLEVAQTVQIDNISYSVVSEYNSDNIKLYFLKNVYHISNPFDTYKIDPNEFARFYLRDNKERNINEYGSLEVESLEELTILYNALKLYEYSQVDYDETLLTGTKVYLMDFEGKIREGVITKVGSDSIYPLTISFIDDYNRMTAITFYTVDEFIRFSPIPNDNPNVINDPNIVLMESLDSLIDGLELSMDKLQIVNEMKEYIRNIKK